MSQPSNTNTLAIVSLVLGILGWCLLPFLGSIGAVITGHMARSAIRKSGGTESGDGLALGGLVLGYLAIGLGVLTIIAIVLFFGGLVGLASIL